MRRPLSLLLFVPVVVLFACGDHPGGTVGDACDTRGSSSECEAGYVCDDVDWGGSSSDGLGDDTGSGRFCLKRCDDHGDCDPSERCNGVSGDDGKACHPNDDSDDDDLGDDGLGNKK